MILTLHLLRVSPPNPGGWPSNLCGGSRGALAVAADHRALAPHGFAVDTESTAGQKLALPGLCKSSR